MQSSTELPTQCRTQCHWTSWFNENHPASHKEGDRESFEIITAKGKTVCKSKMHLKDIQCRAVNFPKVPLKKLGQVVQCDLSSGLICESKNNRGRFKMCFDYEIMFLCCDDRHCPPVNLHSTSISTTQKTSVVSSTIIIPTKTHLVATQSPSRLPPHLSTTKGYSTLTSSQLTRTQKNETANKITIGTSPQISSSPTGFSIAPKTSPSNTLTKSGGTSFAVLETTKMNKPTTLVIVPSTVTSEDCSPRCYWTIWFDENHPGSRNKGDSESFETSSLKGKHVCKSKTHLKDIQCRAVNYPNVPLEKLGQIIQCDLYSGLICQNQNNKGLFNMCLNYEIRFLCCDDDSHCLRVSTNSSPSTFDLSTTTSDSEEGHLTSISSVAADTSKSLKITAKSNTTSHPISLPSSVLTQTSQQSTSPLATTQTERPDTCMVDGSTFEVGSPVPSPPQTCQDCKCIWSLNGAFVKCMPTVCQENCQLPGKSWHPAGNNCTGYECEPDTLMVVKKVVSCPEQKNLTCEQIDNNKSA
ncbi:mucin-5B-like [Spea bombifrons]|uniref:mucin-5B-like n=1 Tax=Spea bombifrons TaxID=233779 RepID=UPI00234A957A|nr:mucin-5B-like [Spea bombifrons]